MIAEQTLALKADIILFSYSFHHVVIVTEPLCKVLVLEQGSTVCVGLYSMWFCNFKGLCHGMIKSLSTFLTKRQNSKCRSFNRVLVGLFKPLHEQFGREMWYGLF